MSSILTPSSCWPECGWRTARRVPPASNLWLGKGCIPPEGDQLARSLLALLHGSSSPRRCARCHQLRRQTITVLVEQQQRVLRPTRSVRCRHCLPVGHGPDSRCSPCPEVLGVVERLRLTTSSRSAPAAPAGSLRSPASPSEAVQRRGQGRTAIPDLLDQAKRRVSRTRTASLTLVARQAAVDRLPNRSASVNCLFVPCRESLRCSKFSENSSRQTTVGSDVDPEITFNEPETSRTARAPMNKDVRPPEVETWKACREF